MNRITYTNAVFPVTQVKTKTIMLTNWMSLVKIIAIRILLKFNKA
jgi:hypothetical protein